MFLRCVYRFLLRGLDLCLRRAGAAAARFLGSVRMGGDGAKIYAAQTL